MLVVRFDTDQPAGRPVREQREEHAVCAGASRGSSAWRLAVASARSRQRHWLPGPLVWSGAMTCAPVCNERFLAITCFSRMISVILNDFENP